MKSKENNNKKKEQKDNLSQWSDEVSKNFPKLSKPQALVLAMFSFAMAVTGCCNLATCAGFIASLLDIKENTSRQRLREFYKDKKHKAGDKRQEIVVRKCFPYLIKWILSKWQSSDQRMAIALDATALGERFIVLTIAVVYRGSFLPIGWATLRANEKGAWKPHWLKLIRLIGPHIPKDWTVIVLTDRGLYAKWMYKAIKKQGWHPYMRINKQGYFKKKGRKKFEPLSNFITGIGCCISMKGTCFKTNGISCTVLIRWEEGYEHAWIIVTDLPIGEAEAVWYGLRAWIECGFKDSKRGGLQWQRTRMDDPKRVERLWLVMSVTMIWLVCIGTEAEETEEEGKISGLEEYAEAVLGKEIGVRRRKSGTRVRWISCFKRGFVTLLAKLISGCNLPLGYLKPEAWPSTSKVMSLNQSQGPPLPLTV